MDHPLDHFAEAHRMAEAQDRKLRISRYEDSVNDPYARGFLAWRDTFQELGLNPYNVATDEWNLWRAGWFAARR